MHKDSNLGPADKESEAFLNKIKEPCYFSGSLSTKRDQAKSMRYEVGGKTAGDLKGAIAPFLSDAIEK